MDKETKKSLDRLKWRFGSNNAFRPNKNDAVALNHLIGYVQEKEKKQIVDNELFGKLYIWAYGQLLKFYGCTVFNKEPQKYLGELLTKSTGRIVEELKDQLNHSEMYTVFDLSGTKPFDHIHLTHLEHFFREKGYDGETVKRKMDAIVEKRNSSNEELQKVLEDFPEVKELMYKGKGIWDFATVSENMESMVNAAINTYGPGHLEKVK